MSTISIVLRKDKINKKEDAPIHFRVTANRRSTYISSGIKIPIKYWDEKKCKVKSGYPNSVRVNNLLAKSFSEAQAKMLDSVTENKNSSVTSISKAINGKGCPSFFELAEMINNRSLADGKIGTYDIRKAMIKKFSDFNKGKDLLLTDITTSLLQKYDYHLQTVLNNSANTRHRDFKYLKMVFKEAYKLDYIEGVPNPFDKYTIKTTSTTKEYLTEEEIDKIAALDLTQNKNHEISRNIFLFVCYAYGVRISDIILLRKSHINGDRIKLNTKKTNQQLDVKLPQKALKILDWFSIINPDNEFLFGLAPKDLDLKNPSAVDSVISAETARYNKFLKIIAKKAKIDKPISSHIARHSFGTRALRMGLDIYQVSTLMTHSSLKQTQAYAKIVSSELDKAADKL